MTANDARFVDVYNRYYKHVYVYSRRRTTADRVDDVVAETFLAAWRKIDDVPEGDATLPWLYGVAYRVLSKEWRTGSRRKRLNDKLANLGVESVRSSDDFLVVNQESELVLNAMSRLKPKDREMLRLAVWEEVDQATIAVVLDISVGAVRQRLYNAKKNLTSEYNRLESKNVLFSAAQKRGAQ